MRLDNGSVWAWMITFMELDGHEYDWARSRFLTPKEQRAKHGADI